MLKIRTDLPDGLLQSESTELQSLLGAPTLIHLPGRREEPLFVSILLHGNETTGWHAVQGLLRKYQEQSLPRALSLYIGNVSAAAEGLRRLDGQPDYNRVWPGTEEPGSQEARMMQQVVEEMRQRKVFASIDVHNNTGINPHYGCINRIDHRFFHLATLFSRTVVYFTRPTGVQSTAMAQYCPAVTVECGKVGQAYSDQHAMEFLDASLHLAEIPEHPIAEHDIDLFHTVATVKVPEQFSFGFGEHEHEILFEDDLDHLNFRELKQGTRVGRVAGEGAARLQVLDNEKRDVSDQFFSYEDNEIRTARPVMPSMLTLDERVIRQDCLCYLMERYRIDVPGEPA